MTLFYLPTCPHCHRVITWIEGNGLTDKFNYIDCSKETGAAELKRASDQQSVPCLVTDDGRCLVGDDDILAFLQKVYA
ncbi:glutaredoxin [Atopobiaceae bacterium 24-176]